MKEFMKLLEEKGVIERFVERHKMSMESTRNKNGVPNWIPPKEGVELGAAMGLQFEMENDEEIEQAFMNLACTLAMDAVTELMAKIALEEK